MEQSLLGAASPSGAEGLAILSRPRLFRTGSWIEDHQCHLTTCALIKLASVEHDDQLKRSDCEDLFENAVRLLDEAIRKSTRRHFISSIRIMFFSFMQYV